MNKIDLYKIVHYYKMLVVSKIDRSFEINKCCLLYYHLEHSTLGISLIQSHSSVFQSPSGAPLESSAVTLASASTRAGDATDSLTASTTATNSTVTRRRPSAAWESSTAPTSGVFPRARCATGRMSAGTAAMKSCVVSDDCYT